MPINNTGSDSPARRRSVLTGVSRGQKSKGCTVVDERLRERGWKAAMAISLPEPLALPWELKPVSSATAGSETLADGCKKFWVKHEVLKGVTPAMLVWWFSLWVPETPVR
jgi:hypothetical protein